MLQAYAAVQQVIAEQGTFHPATREAIGLVVGTVDRCEYCQAAHTAGGKRAGLTEEQTVAIRKGEVDFEPKLGALLTLVRASVSDVGYVSDEVWQSALEAGWRDTELTEVSAHIGAQPLHQPLQPPRRDRPGHPRGPRPLTPPHREAPGAEGSTVPVRRPGCLRHRQSAGPRRGDA